MAPDSSRATQRAPGLCLIRGGGDLATGVAWRLSRAGWPVVVTELKNPLTVRRAVAVSTAVDAGVVDVEGMIARRADSAPDAVDLARTGAIAVFVSPELPDVGADVVIDARLAKRNIDTQLSDASLVVGLGPGFTAPADCHAVVETQRGHRLGRVIWQGVAAANTGVPGIVGGRGAERVLRAPRAGVAVWSVAIGDRVDERQTLGAVGGVEIEAPFAGVVRGLIADGIEVGEGLKVGDVDPRCEPSACAEISDKALAIGGGVVEAVLTWLNQ
ncbi:MAG: EF2563 family selenium-dependent molybdenum hydroxylase system protein [Actinobacteria bacterium]|nr:EF2563 family selenium-dependent molybdenum hydroxylase system protein [Actinomycetota bacterium]